MQAHTKKFTIFKICTPNYGEFPSIIKKGNWSGIQTFIRPKTCICQNFCVPLQAKFQTMDHDKWQWQEPGTAWRGVGLYHITLTVPSRQPLLGSLIIPNNDPAQARVDVSPFGRTLTNLLWDISKYQPDIQMLHYALMPDHLLSGT